MRVQKYCIYAFLCFWLSGGLLADTNIEMVGRIPIDADKNVGLLELPKVEFSPSSDADTISVPFVIPTRSDVSLTVMSADGDRVRQLLDKVDYEAGDHKIEWDGRDDEANLVPNEAYTLVFTATNENSTHIDDPASYSGGEIIPNIKWNRTTETSLSYQLPAPARVLVRMGVTDGPMVRELRHWRPSVTGKVVDRWNGYDSDNVDYFANRDDLWVVVKAYQLPLYSLITTGNSEYNYREYRAKRGWPRKEPNLDKIELQRDRVRLSQDYFFRENICLGFLCNLIKHKQIIVLDCQK